MKQMEVVHCLSFGNILSQLMEGSSNDVVASGSQRVSQIYKK